MIAPKYHADSLVEIPDRYLIEILPLAKKIVSSMGYTDYNLLQVLLILGGDKDELTHRERLKNNGSAMPAIHVSHFHFHIIPKHSVEDGLVFSAEDFATRKLERSKEELTEVLLTKPLVCDYELIYGAGFGEDENSTLRFCQAVNRR